MDTRETPRTNYAAYREHLPQTGDFTSTQERDGAELDCPDLTGYAELGIPRFVVGMMHRYERKMRENVIRGRRHWGFHGRKFNRRKVKGNSREWNYWQGKWNRLRNGINYVTGYWWELPDDCNSI